MALNKAAFDLIKQWEGLRLTAYQDGGGVWTIGYGHTAGAGLPNPKKGMRITATQAEKIFRDDLVEYEKYVKKYVRVPLNENQYGALVSFCFNVGPSQFSKSTLVKKLNRKDYLGASREFDKWVNDNGKRVQGLVNRRNAEQALFLRPTVIKSSFDPAIRQPDDPGVSSGNWFIRLFKYLFSGGKQ